MATYSAFVYGTLMHPRILKRVIGNDASHLKLAPALLFEHTRHKVKQADYPGVVPYEDGRKHFGRELTQDERCVRGTLVTGLTSADITCLDIFEGSEYDRRKVNAHPLQPLFDMADYAIEEDASLVPSEPPPIPLSADLLPAMQAETYVYGDITNLEVDLWSFHDFVQNNAWKWHGAAADSSEFFTEVDRRRALEPLTLLKEISCSTAQLSVSRPQAVGSSI